MGTLAASKSLSALDTGLRWYALFGSRPWVARMTVPDVFVPAPAALPFPPSPSSLPVYAGVFAQYPPGGRRHGTRPITLQTMAVTVFTGRIPLSIPGKAYTLTKVKEFFQHYPWIADVNPQWEKSHFRSYTASKHSTMEAQLRTWLLQIQLYDLAIFEAAVKKYFPHLASSKALTSDLVVYILRDEYLSDLSHLLSAIESFYFGDVTEYKRFTRGLTYEKSAKVLAEFSSFHLSLELSIPHHQKWFFYLARVIFPQDYGYAPPEKSVKPTRGFGFSSFSSIFTLVRRPMRLPDQMRDYELGRGEATWCKLQRELDAFVLNDPETLRGIFKQKETTSNPIEITLVDPSEDQKALVLRTLLDCTVYDPATKFDLPTYRCPIIRLIVKKSTSPGHFRWASLEDYEVLEPKKGSRREFRRIRFVDQW